MLLRSIFALTVCASCCFGQPRPRLPGNNIPPPRLPGGGGLPSRPGGGLPPRPVLPTPPPSNDNVTLAIVGGVDVRPGSRPWHAQLFSIAEGGFNCGGALIDSCHILTAKHCINNQDTNTLWATLGEHNLKVVTGNEVNVTYDDYFVHPSLDIAVIRLQTAVNFNNFIQPISVRAGQINGEPAIGSKPWVTGFGVVDPSTFEVAQILQEVQVEITDKNVCKSRDNINIKDDEMCGGFDQTRTYENVCYGDSGGPVALDLGGGFWTVIGVVKRGVRNCPQNFRFAVYTNVSVAYDWILDLTEDVYVNPNNNRCNKLNQFSLPRSSSVIRQGNRNQNTDNFSLRQSNTRPNSGSSGGGGGTFFSGLFNGRNNNPFGGSPFRR